MAVFDGLGRLGWRLESILSYQNRQIAERAPGSVDDVMHSEAGNATFRKDGRGLDVDVNFQFRRRVAIGGDESFFYGVTPLEEMRAVFQAIRLPAGSRVVGDVEGRIAASRHPLGIAWIDQLSSRAFEKMRSHIPDLERRELAQVGETRIVMMWDSPYDWLAESKKLARRTRGLAPQ